MKKQIVVLCLFIFCLSPSLAFASRSMNISSDKSSLFGLEEMVISASISGFTNGEKIYLKGAFYNDSSTNYFGYTKNGDSWIKNATTATEQRQVEIGNWDGVAVVRSDFDDSGYSGSGQYQFKIGFYYFTSGGNLSSVNWSNILNVSLSNPDPSPAPSPTKSINSTSTSTSTKTSNTTAKPPTPIKSTPTASSNSTSNSLSGSSKPKLTSSAKIAQDFRNFSQNKKLTDSKKQSETKVLGASDQNFAMLPILLGGVLILIAGSWFAFKNWQNLKTWIQN